MSRKSRRYEILFPTQFNDGRDVPQKLLGEATIELLAQFDAMSADTQHIQGSWRHNGTVYRDSLIKYVADIDDTVKNRDWMKEYKRRWKERLDQVEIWLLSFSIRIE